MFDPSTEPHPAEIQKEIEKQKQIINTAKMLHLFDNNFKIEEIGSLNNEEIETLTEGEITSVDEERAKEFLDNKEKIISAIISEYTKFANRNNSDIEKIPGSAEVKEFTYSYKMIPITAKLEGKQLFIKQGQGRKFGRNKSHQVAYYSFIQTKYGKIYVGAGQGPSTKDESKANLNIDAIIGVGLPFSYSSKPQRPGASLLKGVHIPPTEIYFGENYWDWDKILAAYLLKDEGLDKIRKIVIEKMKSVEPDILGRNRDSTKRNQVRNECVRILEYWFVKKIYEKFREKKQEIK